MTPRFLYIIPARAGSKGLPHKNVKILGKLPLVIYSLNFARIFATDEDICVSTNDPEVCSIVSEYGYTVPFLRPSEISTDSASMRDVLLNALDYYEQKQGRYDYIVLLQPTSPFRMISFINESVKLLDYDPDMVVSVNESKGNPYFNLFEEDQFGFLKLSKQSTVASRQEAPKVYQYNGNFYIIKSDSIRTYSAISTFPRILKYTIPIEYSVDIDSSVDWNQAEYLLSNKLVVANGEL